MPIDYEKHKDDFMLYVWNNLDSLNYALRKNITYDPEIYDDVTADTVCRISEYIVNKKVFIKDFKGMFFLSAKRQYVAEQNKKREREKKSDRERLEKITQPVNETCIKKGKLPTYVCGYKLGIYYEIDFKKKIIQIEYYCGGERKRSEIIGLDRRIV